MEPIWAVGCMSGTSLDGVDAALLRTDGEDIRAFGRSTYRPYTENERRVLHQALGAWPGEPSVAMATEVIEAAHLEVLSGFPEAEIIGFHGQTLAHAPNEGRTHQAGNGAALAAALRRPVVWDFRSADVALGGEGAPLAPIFHAACARWIKATAPLAFLNLGGVGNLTWIDPQCDALLAFDTGPANAPMDDIMLASTQGRFDKNGAHAAQGQVDRSLIKEALSHPFYGRIPPKSLDRTELYSSLISIRALPLEDALATLVALITESVAIALDHCPGPVRQVLVTGGGRKNATLMRALAGRLTGTDFQSVEAVGLDGDMLEAQAFAYLAVRVLRGLPTSFPTTTGVAAEVGGGQISRPKALP